jgi:hypothetical protein
VDVIVRDPSDIPSGVEPEPLAILRETEARLVF